MKVSFRWFFTCILIISFLSASSNVDSYFEQQLKLERKIKDQVDSVLSKLTTPDSFNVNVMITVSDPEAPQWDNPEDGDDSANGNGPKSKKKTEQEIDKKLAEDKEAEEKTDLTIKSKVTFDDVELPERQEDFIVLNKFGLEAPLVEDYNDLQPDGKIVLSMSGNGLGEQSAADKEKEEERRREEQENNRKLLSTLSKSTRKVSEVERIWKYNKAIDIYKNLQSAEIIVQLSKGLSNDVKQAAEKYVKSISFNLGPVKPKIKFEYVELGRDFSTSEESKKSMMDYLNLAAQFATFFGIVLGVLLFGFVGNRLIKKFFDLNTGSQNQSSLKMEGGPEKEDDDKDSSAGGAGALAGEGGLSNEFIVNGVERFQNFYENHPEDSILLIKKWIREKSNRQIKALKALVQQMDNKSLAPLMATISEDERVQWKELLDSSLGQDELADANAFIGNQIIQSLMIPEYIRDPNIYAKLVRLSGKDFESLLGKDFDTACLLLPVLGADFINDVLNFIDNDKREKIISKSLGITADSYKGAEDKIRNLLSGFGEETKNKPFLKSLEKLLPKAGKELEESLYQHFVKESEPYHAHLILKKYFPGFLIGQLPESFLKNTLNKYPLKNKIRLMYSMEESEKAFYVDIFAPAGSKAADLVNVEFEAIERDENLIKEIEESRDEYWVEFVGFVRNEIMNDSKIAGRVSELTDNWYNENISSGDTKPHLSAVA